MRRNLLFFFLISHLSCFAKYYSQCGQDQFINETFFKNYKHGVFLDVGAHNGISLSNTYFFEKELGWTGICLEPIPEIFNQLKRNRTCQCICGCASSEHDVLKNFVRFKSKRYEMYSGLIEKFDPQRRALIKQLMTNKKGHDLLQVRCYNLNQILRQARLTHINLLSLDTEGGELEILKSLDFSKIHIDVITVENNYNSSEFETYLKTKGFSLVKALRHDIVFINNNSEWK